MKKVMSTLLVMLVSAMTLSASESTSAGQLKGRILDNENNPLPGAVVILDGDKQSAVTNLDGVYSFPNITTGNHSLKVSYIGFLPMSKLVIVSGNTSTEDIILSDICRELDEVVVTGVFSNQHSAINSQRNNLNITNIVSSDQIGKFPDSNIGDALKRISGINVQYDQGEARFGQVRGTPAEFSSVTINGSRIPRPRETSEMCSLT